MDVKFVVGGLRPLLGFFGQESSTFFRPPGRLPTYARLSVQYYAYTIYSEVNPIEFSRTYSYVNGKLLLNIRKLPAERTSGCPALSGSQKKMRGPGGRQEAGQGRGSVANQQRFLSLCFNVLVEYQESCSMKII